MRDRHVERSNVLQDGPNALDPTSDEFAGLVRHVNRDPAVKPLPVIRFVAEVERHRVGIGIVMDSRTGLLPGGLFREARGHFQAIQLLFSGATHGESPSADDTTVVYSTWWAVESRRIQCFSDFIVVNVDLLILIAYSEVLLGRFRGREYGDGIF